MKISAVIITKNEEKMITGCLRTLSWADEIVIVDTGSTDKTNAIAKKYKARIVNYDGPASYAQWRNKGLKEAKGEWILYVDADERVTPSLRQEIINLVSQQHSVYVASAIPRRNFIFGKEFKHGGQWPDYQKRFFKKSNLMKWIGKVHEEPDFKGKLGYIKNPMLHIKHETLTEMVEKTNDWSEVEGKLMFEAHHPPMTIVRFGSVALREFWLRMIKQMAFLDGGEGIIYAMYQVFSRFISYAKLWELQIKSEARNTKIETNTNV